MPNISEIASVLGVQCTYRYDLLNISAKIDIPFLRLTFVSDNPAAVTRWTFSVYSYYLVVTAKQYSAAFRTLFSDIYVDR